MRILAASPLPWCVERSSLPRGLGVCSREAAATSPCQSGKAHAWSRVPGVGSVLCAQLWGCCLSPASDLVARGPPPPPVLLAVPSPPLPCPLSSFTFSVLNVAFPTPHLCPSVDTLFLSFGSVSVGVPPAPGGSVAGCPLPHGRPAFPASRSQVVSDHVLTSRFALEALTLPARA